MAAAACSETPSRVMSATRPYFILKVWVPPELVELKEFYAQAQTKHNDAIIPVMLGSEQTFDAGFDLVCPGMVSVVAQRTTKINHRIRCSMKRVEREDNHSVGYYLYPRSSTGTKTPLRLANSVGIIDSGYRGDIIAAVDNWSTDDYVVDQSQRIVQLCPPDLSYPMRVVLVDDLDELGVSERGVGGFGSTGV